MSNAAILSAVMLAVALFSALNTTEKQTDAQISPKIVEAFKRWAEEHGKAYTSPKEESYRLQVFAKRFQEAEQINKDSTTWKAGLNTLSDFTQDELNAKIFINSAEIENSLDNVPVQEFAEEESLQQGGAPEIDWVKRGYAPASRQDLPTCKGSYAIAAVGAIESLQKIKRVYRSPLAPQEFIDCTANFGNYGCQGGWSQNCFGYAVSYGINYHSNYPYTGTQGSCRMNSGINKIGQYYKLNSGDTNGLLRALALGPVTVAFDFSWGANYKTGVYTGSCSSNPSYVGLLVGSGTFNGVAYGKIQVYLGTNYGDNGYIYVKLGSCGMSNSASYPVY